VIAHSAVGTAGGDHRSHLLFGAAVADAMARLASAGHCSLLDRFPPGSGGLVFASFVQLSLVVAVARTAGLAGNILEAGLIGSMFLVSATVIL
jgi:hypothetical protein